MDVFSRNSWLRATVARAAPIVLGGMLMLAIEHFVRATPNGPTRDMLSFGGTLTQNGKPLSGSQTLTFAFKTTRGTICSPQATVTPDSTTGAFNAQIDISGCPSSALFDGSDVTVDLSVGGNVIASNQPINPVPYAKYADRVGSPDCPVGYTRDITQPSIVLCKKGVDEVVKVGTGAPAFWIDRYEASLWQNPDGTGMQLGLADGDAQSFGFPRNGQYTTPAYAVSKSGVRPSTYLTWWQAQAACLLSGKRLPRNAEWQATSIGTNDPGASSGANGACVTMAAGPRNTGSGSSCASMWGAQDLIGNVREWVEDWQMAPGLATASSPWPSDYNGDAQWGISSKAFIDNSGTYAVAPAAIRRGGGWPDALGAGMFTLDVNVAPSAFSAGDGFRCVIPR